MRSNGHGDRALVANMHKRTLRAMLADYLEAQATGEPVHTWDL